LTIRRPRSPPKNAQRDPPSVRRTGARPDPSPRSRRVQGTKPVPAKREKPGRPLLSRCTPSFMVFASNARFPATATECAPPVRLLLSPSAKTRPGSLQNGPFGLIVKSFLHRYPRRQHRNFHASRFGRPSNAPKAPPPRLPCRPHPRAAPRGDLPQCIHEHLFARRANASFTLVPLRLSRNSTAKLARLRSPGSDSEKHFHSASAPP